MWFVDVQTRIRYLFFKTSAYFHNFRYYLHVGKVRDIGLDIVPDRPTHANIMGVPFREGEGGNEAEAERLARLLAEQARVHSLGDPRFP